MADIIESHHWSETIYEIAPTDDVLGGKNGINNIQANQLASRTNFLRAGINSLQAQTDDLKTGKTSAGQARKLSDARSIHIIGDVTGGASFDGSTDITIHLSQKNSGVQAGNYRQVAVDTQGRVIDGSNPTTLAGFGITDAASIAYVQSVMLPAGTRLPFAQSVAPTGWTQVTDDSANNRMLRVVNSGEVGIGGVHSPILNNVVPAHTHSFTTGPISADHTHVINDPGHNHGIHDPGHAHGISVRARGSTGAGVSDSGDKVTYETMSHAATTGVVVQAAKTSIWLSGPTSNHTHSGSTDNGSSQTNWQPRYIDMIICEKN